MSNLGMEACVVMQSLQLTLPDDLPSRSRPVLTPHPFNVLVRQCPLSVKSVVIIIRPERTTPNVRAYSQALFEIPWEDIGQSFARLHNLVSVKISIVNTELPPFSTHHPFNWTKHQRARISAALRLGTRCELFICPAEYLTYTHLQ